MVYIEKQVIIIQYEESMEDNFRENGMIIFFFRLLYFGQLGRQCFEEEEELGNIVVFILFRNDVLFVFFVGSMFIGKLIILGEDVGVVDLSNVEVEEDESCLFGFCMLCYDELSVLLLELCLKFWFVMKILDSEVNIVFY